MSATPAGDWAGTPAEVFERILVPRVFLPLAEETLRFAEPAVGDRVLDVACGTGALTRLLAGSVGLTGSVVGLDVNPQMLAVAATRVAAPQVEWREANALELPFVDGEFNLVTCQQGLQFFPDRGLALREMRRVTREGGRLAMSCWRASAEAPGHAAVERWLSAAWAQRPPRHKGFSFPDGDDLRRVVDAAGFVEVDITVFSVSTHWPTVEFFARNVVKSPCRGTFPEVGDDDLADLVAQLREALSEFSLPDGSLRLPQVTHLLSART